MALCQKGGVSLIQEDTRKLWVSTSKKSLISVLNNKKRDIYSIRVYRQAAAPIQNIQYYLLFDISVSSPLCEDTPTLKSPSVARITLLLPPSIKCF